MQSELSCNDARVSANAGHKNGAEMVLAINKTEHVLAMRVPMRKVHEHWLLTGPSLDAREGISLTWSEGNVVHKGILRVQPWSAVLMRA